MTRIALSAAALLFLGACGTTTPPVEKAVAQIDPATAVTISGRVVFTGTPPRRIPLDMSANPACERQHKTPALSEQAIVSADGGLANTFVWVKRGLPDVKWGVPAQAVKLDQDGCIYAPHVLGIMTGQTLEISNSDPVNHDVHAQSATNPAWNESQAPRAEKKFKHFEKQEILFPVTCGVHPWMRAYIGVVDHPFFAVTATDGSFVLKGIPPGKYVVEAVHETCGRKEMSVIAGPKEQKQVQFTYAGE